MAEIRPSIQAMFDEMVGFRHMLHRTPELSGQEEQTAKHVRGMLDSRNISHEDNIGGHGIVATIQGNQPGPTVGIRVDMDALPITEKNTFRHASKNPGVMHACGHDVHTTMGIMTAYALQESQPRLHGTAKIIFQPAEENTTGAQAMLDDGLLQRHPMDYIFFPHNAPFLDIGTASVNETNSMAASDYFYVSFEGIGGHASSPWKVRNPSAAIRAFAGAVTDMRNLEINPFDPVTINDTSTNIGNVKAFNVTAPDGTLVYTLRSYNPEVRDYVQKRFHEIAYGIKGTHLVNAKVEYRKGAEPTINTPDEALYCADVCRGILGNENVIWNPQPSMAAEDGGLLIQAVGRGAHLWIGQADPKKPETTKLLHAEDYDGNDDILPLAEILTQLAERKLGIAPTGP